MSDEKKIEYAGEVRGYSVDDSGRRLSASGRRVSTVDDVFGEIVEGGEQYPL